MVNAQLIGVHPKTKSLLDDLKVHARQPYNEIILELIKQHILNNADGKLNVKQKLLIKNATG